MTQNHGHCDILRARKRLYTPPPLTCPQRACVVMALDVILNKVKNLNCDTASHQGGEKFSRRRMVPRADSTQNLRYSTYTGAGSAPCNGTCRCAGAERWGYDSGKPPCADTSRRFL